MRRRVAAADVRDRYAAELEELALRYAKLAGCPWGATAAKLRAGHPHDVSGWEISEWVPGVELYDRYRLESDGSITEVS